MTVHSMRIPLALIDYIYHENYKQFVPANKCQKPQHIQNLRHMLFRNSPHLKHHLRLETQIHRERLRKGPVY